MRTEIIVGAIAGIFVAGYFGARLFMRFFIWGEIDRNPDEDP